MKLKIIFIFIFGCFFFCFSKGYAQTSGSARSDAAAELRKYRNSKHYKDSVKHARKAKAQAVKDSRQAHLDSVKHSKSALTDSLSGIKKSKQDSLAEVQKQRADQVAATKKYKASRRYSDSVAIVKRTKLDGSKRRQKAIKDSISKVRTAELNLSKSIRKKQADSIKLVRTRFTDSVKMVRKRRVDSLNKIKLAKEKSLKAKDKQSEAKKKMALELKMKSKREAFTNKSMLKKKWSPFRRFTQNSFTHYNYYFNANRKLEEANANMLRAATKEKYDSLIKIFPFDPDKDSSLMAGEMDSIIRKVSVGLQIHDPRVKWANDMFLLMGKAYYFKGKYENAAVTFKYIISNDEESKKEKEGIHQKGPTSIVEEDKSKFGLFSHKSVHNEAIIWLARVYTQMKMVENGQAVLSLLSTDPNMPEDLKGEVVIGRAFGYMTDKNYTATSEQLTEAIKDDNLPSWQRLRAAFLNAQILQRDGKYNEAITNYEIALDYFPKIDMDFYARKSIAYCTLMAGGDVADGIKPLKKVLNDAKYSSYNDQVYYVLGQMSAKAGKTKDAIDYLGKSATAPKASKKQKAISYAALGDVYYNTGSYNNAKNAYDSSAKYNTSGDVKDESVIAAVQRSKGLAEVSQPTAVIHDQDSLRDLASMSKKEQLSVVRHYIRDLEQKLKDSIKNAADAGNTGGGNQQEAASESGEPSNWYFANPALMQQGAADFKRKWGNRPLTDNWRRASGVNFTNTSSNQSGLEEDGATDTKGATSDNGLPTEESLLAKIPNTKEQQDLSIRTECKAYIMLAKAYLRQLDDYNQSLATLDTLDSRFPNHNQKEEDLYLRYQIAIRKSELEKARGYADELVAKFPKSPYVDLVKPRKDDKVASANGGKQVSQYFDETYELILKHQYSQALSNIEIAKKEYNNPTYKKRFQVAEASCYAAQGNFNMADTILNGFIAANPSDSLSGWAKDVSSYVKEVRKTGVPSWYNDTIVYVPLKSAKANAATAAVKPPPPPKPKRPDNVPVSYSYKPADEHYSMIVLNSLDSRTAKLKAVIDSFNNSKGYSYQMLIDLYSTEEVVITVQKFNNEEQSRNYLDTIDAAGILKDYKVDEVKHFVVSSANYRKLFYEKELEDYYGYYNRYYKKP